MDACEDRLSFMTFKSDIDLKVVVSCTFEFFGSREMPLSPWIPLLSCHNGIWIKCNNARLQDTLPANHLFLLPLTLGLYSIYRTGYCDDFDADQRHIVTSLPGSTTLLVSFCTRQVGESKGCQPTTNQLRKAIQSVIAHNPFISRKEYRPRNIMICS